MKYKIGFINPSYKRFYQQHRQEILKAIDRCYTNGDFILRKDVKIFEKKLANFIGVKYAVGVNSGTDALRLSLEALNIGKGDEVITVSHTFIATIEEIVHVGATPVLIDVKEDGLMDTSQIEKFLTKQTKAIMPVHLSGAICDMKEIKRIAHKYKLIIIEDACQSFGGKQNDIMSGAFGDTGCFSFIAPKLMGVGGDAGAIVTNRKDIYEKLLLLRNHWNITQNALLGIQPKAPKIMGWGWNSRLDNIHAAVLNIKFRYIKQILKRRKGIAEQYIKGLKDLSIKLPSRKKGEVWQEFIIQISNIWKFKKFMDKKRIELLIRDTTPNHLLPGLNLNHFSLPITEKLATRQVRLPIYPQLTNQEVDYIIKSIQEFYD